MNNFKDTIVQYAVCPQCQQDIEVKNVRGGEGLEKFVEDPHVKFLTHCPKCDTQWQFKLNISEI